MEKKVEALLEKYCDLTEFEAWRIVIEIERNEIIKDAFGVTSSNSTPKFLEDIAISLREITTK